MLARSRSSLASQSPFVLEDVMAELMRKHVTQHEASQHVAMPGNDAVVDLRSGPSKAFSVLRRYSDAKPPRMSRLLIQDNVPGSDKATECEVSVGRRRGGELDEADAVIRGGSKKRERTTHVGRRRRMVTAGAGPARTDGRECGTSCGADTPGFGTHAV
jgi:hypothetical protein